MKTIIHEKIVFAALILLIASCSNFGNISKTYDSSQERIWQAINVVVTEQYGGVELVKADPPTVTSKLKLKDKEFGLDKRSFQAIVALTGFKRPFVVDAEIRVYPDTKVSEDYDTDPELAYQLQEKIRAYIKEQEGDFSFKKEFSPY